MQLKGLIGVNHSLGLARAAFQQIIIALVLLAWTGSLMSQDLSITQLANEGVMVTDGETRVLIDAMVVEPYSVYGGLPDQARSHFHQRSGPFSDIDLVLVSHRHHDHNQPAFACEFMLGSTESLLVSSSQVIGLMRERCRNLTVNSPRVRQIDPQYDAPVTVKSGGATVDIFPLSHGTRKYARIQNYGHLIDIGGFKVVHLGDAAMDPSDFARAGLDSVDLDVALIPFWYFQPGVGNEIVEKFLQAPNQIAVHIPPGEMEEIEGLLLEAFPEVIVLKNPLDTLRITVTGQPLP
jgi:L-ascorbate metabolism protein UlaG (beta-lactamase superfamily)